MPNPKRNLTSRTVPAGSLTPAWRDAMWGLYSAYYADVERARFDSDLDAKSHVILLLARPSDAVCGFSTLQSYRRVVQGRPVVVVYSGDTVVDRAHWGQTRLQRAFLAFVTRTWLANPGTPCYWFLISKGYKTYLLLARNFPEHWPRHDRPTPAWQAALLDSLAREKFADAWRPERGVLTHRDPLGRLKEGVAPLDQGLLALPDVRFFVEANPGHADGDELCCLGRVGLLLWLSYTAKWCLRALGLNPARR
jgi:hypothetical protein